MINNELIFVIDGTYLMHKMAFVMHKNRTLYGELYNGMMYHYNRISNLYPFKGIILVSDKGTTWRKGIYPDYKGKRIKNEEIDWDFVKETYKQFKETLQEQPRVKIFEKDGLEGDDWISKIVKNNKSKSVNTLIYSNDSDIQQLIECTNNCITFMVNENLGKEVVFLPENYKEFIYALKSQISNRSIFEESFDDNLVDFLDNLDVTKTVVEVDKNKALFTKLVKGDKGDNIPSIIKVKDRGIGDSGADKLWDIYLNEYGFLDLKTDAWMDNVVDLVCDYKKVPFETYNKQVLENLKLNYKLIKL